MPVQWYDCYSLCQMNGICEQTYYRNLKKLREELCQNLPVPATAPEKPVAFKKLEVMSPLPGTKAAVIIRLRKRQILRLPIN